MKGFKKIKYALFFAFFGISILSLFLFIFLFFSPLYSIPYKNEIINHVHRASTIALFVSLFVAVAVSILFSKFFSDPIIRLSEIAKMIAKGKFPQTIIHKSKFEIGELEKSMELMNESLQTTIQKFSSKNSQISAVLSSMNEGVLAVDRRGRVIFANSAIEKILGVTEPEILQKTIREVIRNNEITDIVEKSLKTGERVKEEINVVLPFEGVFDANANPVIDEEKNILGVVCVLHDITEIRKLTRHRSEFVANVSHELKTPLTAIRSYVETLLLGAIGDKENNIKFLGKIDKHAKNLSALIDDILEISKLESKKELGPFVRIDITKIMEHAVDTVLEKAQKKNIIFGKKCQGESIFVFGIEDHIYRAILNVLDNAVNYSNHGGSVKISCAKNDGKVVISISDTGIGISKDHIPRLFERFYRVDNARSRDLGGTGLGLAIVKHVMSVHNGEVNVISNEGTGSTFTLIFPGI
ncbi:hypothetical protein A2230_06055 [candidate division WOR-1 bacterium RIFOXYA2_FULL_36_21]|uniref:histidine kinase n=1 Tax=candidate division WOR-1 bacterium RIFOXYB2_FULL_36_35 TaxID=1802578 RepID=A0A1F4S2B5_UNCSA|nr:MAG: hypothetical protein A2230_06055 [candidate division WOR-1 bacterium RIFOXYA2_FULL_36_21]OGC14584.1 MAG: hypothetical protein A2290_01905 [candidate division WOR-1 bacterium RIFOXYB2_FULL_36_35]OGC16256.1 MAG: hypothetical protein A2282_01460 [candidate division WOR-1 bacterium RIFOXYA12_FULL_36_13]